MKNATPLTQIESFLYIYSTYFGDQNKMCIIGTFSAAYNEIPEKIQIGAKNYLDFVINWLSVTFESGRKYGHFKFEGSAEELADFRVATLTGSLQIGRVRGAEYFKKLLENLKKTLKP